MKLKYYLCDVIYFIGDTGYDQSFWIFPRCTIEAHKHLDESAIAGFQVATVKATT